MDTGSYCRKTLKIETAKAELVTTEIAARYSNKNRDSPNMGPSRPNQSRIRHLRQHQLEAVSFVVGREDLDNHHLGGERRGKDHVLVAAD